MKLAESGKQRRLRTTEVLSRGENEPVHFSVREVVASDVRTILTDFDTGRYADRNREYHMYFLLELAVLFPEARQFVIEKKDQFVAYMDQWDSFERSNETNVPLLFAQVFPEEKDKYRKRIIEGYQKLADYAAQKFQTQPQIVYSADVLLLLCVYAPEQREEWKRSYQPTLAQDLNEIKRHGSNKRFDLLSRAAALSLLYPELKDQLQPAFVGMPELFRQRLEERLYTNIGSTLDMEIVFGETIGALDEGGIIQQSGRQLGKQQALPERLTA